MKKTSLQDIAEQLQVSRITVSKVLNNKPGVSIETKKKVINKLVESGYKIIDSQLVDLVKENKENDYRCVAVVATAPEFSEFWLKIINAISNELSKSHYECIYCFLSRSEENLPTIINSKHVSGIIVINVYDDSIIKTLSDFGVPAVFLDISPRMFNESINGDIVLLDGYRSILEITNTIIAKGRKKIGFIGDITYSKTILERWEGYKGALKQNNLEILPEYCFTNSSYGHFYYKEEIEKVLDSISSMPKAFVCANDFIAFMLIGLLKKKNFKIPEDIAVSGFDDIRENLTGDSELTTVTINTDVLGKRLVHQILLKIDEPAMPNEIIYIEPKVVYRSSTN